MADAPDSAVVVSTETVQKVVTKEPREVLFRISRASGEIEADVSYETVTRIDGVAVSWVPLKSTTLKWRDLTNLVPALSASLEQFKAAAKASMTNTP